MKKIISLTLALIMFISIFSAQYVYADTSDSVILARIEDLCEKLENTYFTKDRSTGCGKKSSGHSCENCLTSNIVQTTWFKDMFGYVSTSNFANSYGKDVSYTRAAYSCAGFANFAEWYIFKSSNSDVISTTKIGTYDFNYNNISTYAKVGDILRLNNSHSVIFISASSSSINVLDSNFNGTYNCMVDRHNISYDKYSYFTISRSTNRQISPEEPETDSRPFAPSIVEVFPVSGNNITENENFKISWNDGKNATEYAVCIRSLPSKEVIHYKGGIDPSINSYTYNLPIGQYDVAVITVNSDFPTSLGVNYNYSDYVEFEVKEVPRPVAPSIVEVFPLGWNNITENENFKISWNDGKNATEYAVCIRSLPSKEVIHYKGGIDPSINSYTYNLPVGQYDVAVITVNSDFPTSLGVNYNYSNYVEFEVKENITTESAVTKSGTKLIINTKVHNFEEPYDILVVGYKDDRFVTMKRVQHDEQNSPYTIEGDIDKIKIMIWDSLKSMIPLCEAEIITSSEFIKE